MTLESAIEHLKEVLDNHISNKRLFATNDEFYKHCRLLKYLNNLYVDENNLNTNSVLIYPVSIRELVEDIEDLQRSLCESDFACSACKMEHRDILRWLLIYRDHLSHK